MENFPSINTVSLIHPNLQRKSERSKRMALLKIFRDKRVVVRSAVVTSLSIIAAAIIGLALPVLQNILKDDKIELSAVDVIESRPFPILDVRIRNPSDEPAIITGLSLKIHDVSRQFAPLSVSPPLKRSHVYHLLIDPLTLQNNRLTTSTLISAKSVDRFAIVVAASGRDSLSTDRLKMLLTPSEWQKFRAKYPASDSKNTFRVTSISVTASLLETYIDKRVIESQPLRINIAPDKLFSPEGPQEPFSAERYLSDNSLSSGNQNTPVSEEIELLGLFETEKSRKFLEEQAAGPNNLVAVTAAIALYRLDKSFGLSLLRHWAEDVEAPIWKRILAVRGLIRVGEIDTDLFRRLLREGTVLALELIRVAGYFKDPIAVEPLGDLLNKRDEIADARFKVYSVGHKALRALPNVISDAIVNRDSEEIIASIGCIGDPKGETIILKELEKSHVFRELSYDVLVASIYALRMIGSNVVDRIALEKVIGPIDELDGLRDRVLSALSYTDVPSTLFCDGFNHTKSTSTTYDQLIYERENDEFPIFLFSRNADALKAADSTAIKWMREPEKKDTILEYLENVDAKNLHVTHLHFHNPPEPYGIDSQVITAKDMKLDSHVKILIDESRRQLPDVKRRFLNGLTEESSLYVNVFLANS